MAEKYFFRYYDVEGVEFRCGISSTNYVGASTEVGGRCFIDFPEAENHLTAIRGAGMRMDLEASTTQTFSDLFTENEREWRVTLTRAGTTIFEGYLDPEGLFQSFVDDRWDIQLDVVDGLGFLENLAYVDGSGATYTGVQKLITIVSNCLSRTGILLNINVAVDIVYTGLSEGADVFDNAQYKVDRFVRDDGETIMDCKEVLTSVLDVFSACICQHEGEWYIYRPSHIANDNSPDFFKYNSSGVYQSTFATSRAFSIGSHINAAAIHHIGANQQLSTKSSVGAFRVNYKYGLDDSIFENINLIWNSGTASDIDGWTELVDADVNPGNGLVGAALDGDPTPVDIFQSDNIAVSQDDALTFEMDILFENLINWVPVTISLDDDASADVYQLDDDGQWVLSGSNVIDLIPEQSNVAIENNFQISAAPSPVDGQITFTFQNPRLPFVTVQFATVKTFKVYPSKDNTVQGEFHTVERTTNPSTRAPEVQEVFNGDNDTNIYFGSIFKADGTTRTDTWKRKGITETKPVLQITAEEKLRINAKPAQVFQGDVYGYIPFLSIISIATITGDFMVLSYSYDTKLNRISLKLKEIFSAELGDIDYTFTLDYGETVKPTIRG